MRLFYVVAVDVNEARLVEDWPSEPIAESIKSEILTNLDSAASALAIESVQVECVGGLEL